MKDFFKKNGILLFCLLFFICSAGFTVWFLFLIFTGGSAVGQVTHRTQDSKKANITIEYQTDGQNYSVKKQYGRNTGLTVGEEVKVFFQEDKPEKGYILKDCTSTFIIAAVSGTLTAVVLKAGKKKNNDE